MNAIIGTTTLTPKADMQGKVIKLKVFWKTTKFWSDSDIADYHKSAKRIAEKLLDEKYWDKDGRINSNRFTCEDFAIRVLCEYAQAKGLPVKLTTGAGTYRNMEPYNPEAHDRYVNDMWGFAERVMQTFGARDMQRVGANTVAVGSVEELKDGDILAKAKDKENKIAHHIQLIIEKLASFIFIYQGNTGAGGWLSKLYRLVGHNPADPQDSWYAGMPVQRGKYVKNKKETWEYIPIDYKGFGKNKLEDYELYRWNFMGFNT